MTSALIDNTHDLSMKLTGLVGEYAGLVGEYACVEYGE